MRSLLQFLGAWGAMIAFTVGGFSIALWALSIDDDPTDERVASSLLLAIFWPVIWLRLRLTGKNRALVFHRGAPSRVSIVTSQPGMQEKSMQRFKTVREAKEYLVGVITKEAQHDGTALTEVEEKMLYFTETGWTLPDMKEISSEFDRDYDQDEYERKIGSIIARISARLSDGSEEERIAWRRALEKLSRGDHYLLVLIDSANPVRKGARHNLKMLIIALVFFVLAALDVRFRHWLVDK